MTNNKTAAFLLQEYIKYSQSKPFEERVAGSRKMSYADKTRIVKDWDAEIGDEFKYDVEGFKRSRRGLAFCNLKGPLFMVIDLYLGSDYYNVKTFIFNLAYDTAYLPQTIWNSARPGLISKGEHKDGCYKIAIQSIKEERPIMFGQTRLEDIFENYRYVFQKLQRCLETFGGKARETYENIASNIKVKEGREMLRHNPPVPTMSQSSANEAYAHPAIVAAWAGEEAKAKEYYEWGYDIMASHYYLPENIHMLHEWAEQHKKMIESPEKLRQTVRDQVVKHNLTYAPYRDIIGVPYKERGLPNLIIE